MIGVEHRCHQCEVVISNASELLQEAAMFITHLIQTRDKVFPKGGWVRPKCILSLQYNDTYNCSQKFNSQALSAYVLRCKIDWQKEMTTSCYLDG